MSIAPHSTKLQTPIRRHMAPTLKQSQERCWFAPLGDPCIVAAKFFKREAEREVEISPPPPLSARGTIQWVDRINKRTNRCLITEVSKQMCLLLDRAFGLPQTSFLNLIAEQILVLAYLK